MNQAWPPDPKTPRGAWEYHATILPKAAKKPIRIWMEVVKRTIASIMPKRSSAQLAAGQQPHGGGAEEEGLRLHRYVFALGAGHVDNRVVMQTLLSALEWLWRDYPKN
ncbi:MAG: hypothetical protein U1E93_04710 [Alphaproteobacteria bacterium]